MALVAPHEGEQALLKYMLNHTDPSDHTLRLYKNDLTPDDDSVFADFTESDEAGYSAITLVGTNWVFSTEATYTQATYAQQIFTFTTSANVYGYYITSSDSKVLWAERFDGAPSEIPVAGGTVKITPTINLK